MSVEAVTAAMPPPRDTAAGDALRSGGARRALHLRLGANPDAVRGTLLEVRAALERAGLGETDTANAELVLAEALNNIVEHAFPKPDPAAWIELTLVPGHAGIGCELRDNGQPMPRGRLPHPSLPGCTPRDGAGALQNLPEGGFGWHLIRTLARDLCYAREFGTNRLVLRIPCADGR